MTRKQTVNVTSEFYTMLADRVMLRKDVDIDSVTHILHVATSTASNKDEYSAKCSAKAWIVAAARTPTHCKLPVWVEVQHE